MELDDLRPALAALTDRMDALELDLRRSRADSRVGNARRVLRHLGWCQAIVLVVWIVVVATMASFWIEHRSVPHLLAAGLVLHAYGIAAIWVSAVQILLAARTYHTVPVVLFLRRVSELQRFRAVSSLALGVPWWILWLLVTMVGARWLLGIDLYERAPLWIELSLAIGLGGMAVTVWIARRLDEPPPNARGFRRVLDDLAGRKIRCANLELRQLAGFESEDATGA